jgi:DNA polymerase sigma
LRVNLFTLWILLTYCILQLLRKYSARLNETVACVYNKSRPTSDILDRRNVFSQSIQALIVQAHSSDITIQFSTFGSIEAALDTVVSDIDISLCFVHAFGYNETVKSKPSKVLNDIADKLENSINKKFIDRRTGERVKVPVLKIHDPQAEISLDISIENTNAQKKTCLLRVCGDIDQRFRYLVCLVKYWAHCRQINDAKYNTLNSLAYTLCVVQFLQTRNPPILPCFPVLTFGNYVSLASFQNICSDFGMKNKGFGGGNKQRSEELLVHFMFFMFEFCSGRPERMYINVRDGMLKPKEDCEFKDDFLCIEDLLDPTINVAKSVRPWTFEQIKSEFSRACTIFKKSGDFDEVCQC